LTGRAGPVLSAHRATRSRQDRADPNAKAGSDAHPNTGGRHRRGNACHVDITKLPANVRVVSNVNGLIGGVALWREDGPTTPR
jgi:hypothetical protein